MNSNCDGAYIHFTENLARIRLIKQQSSFSYILCATFLTMFLDNIIIITFTEHILLG